VGGPSHFVGRGIVDELSCYMGGKTVDDLLLQSREEIESDPSHIARESRV